MMKKSVIAFIVSLISVCAFAGNDDIMITRDGNMLEVKIVRISNSEITFVDLKKRRRGELKAPTNYVYMIMREKGNNVFFDEDGNQTTSKAVKYSDKENLMFLNNGKIFPIYNFTINKDGVQYKMADKKKAQLYESKKSEIFLIRNSDGTTTLFNNKYIEEHRKSKQQATVSSAALPAPPATTTGQSTQQTAVQPQHTTTSVAPQPGESVKQSDEIKFCPAIDISAQEIQQKVHAANPYTLYRKGTTAEYAFEQNGKQTKFWGVISYLIQTVEDEKIENGLLVSQIRQDFYNQKHEPSKTVSNSAREFLFPTEIDTAGTFHLTHDITRDIYFVKKRNGYAMLIPNILKTGDNLRCSTINDEAKNLLGGNQKLKTEYADFKVEAEENITTPAGTFACMKLSGKVTDFTSGKPSKYKYNWWIARGIGFVRYEIYSDDNKNNSPLVIYLNKLELK